MNLEWVIVNDSFEGKPIGTVGFAGDKVAVVSSFYEDGDWNNDGKISLKEKILVPFTGKGRALAAVITNAYADPDILMRDPSINEWRGQAVTNFAGGMIVEGIYTAYFAQGVSKAATGVASSITSSVIKSYVIRKGLEKFVKESYMRSLTR